MTMPSARISDDQDVGVTGLPMPGCHEPLDHLAQLGAGHRGEVIPRS